MCVRACVRVCERVLVQVASQLHVSVSEHESREASPSALLTPSRESYREAWWRAPHTASTVDFSGVEFSKRQGVSCTRGVSCSPTSAGAPDTSAVCLTAHTSTYEPELSDDVYAEYHSRSHLFGASGGHLGRNSSPIPNGPADRRALTKKHASDSHRTSPLRRSPTSVTFTPAVILGMSPLPALSLSASMGRLPSSGAPRLAGATHLDHSVALMTNVPMLLPAPRSKQASSCQAPHSRCSGVCDRRCLRTYLRCWNECAVCPSGGLREACAGILFAR